MATDAPNGPSQTGPGSEYTSFQWIMAWLILFILLAFFNKTRIGHLVLYYALVLMILFILVSNAGWFANILAPFQSLTPGLSGTSNAGPIQDAGSDAATAVASNSGS